MFASIPHRSTRVRRSYICTACRCGLLARDEILSVLRPSSQTQTPNQQLATFSTSANHAARTRKPGARPAVRDIQKTVAQLNNLREAFLEDLKGEVKEEKQKGKGERETIAIKTNKIGGDRREKIEKEENLSTPAKGTLPKKKPKPAKHAAEKKDTVSLNEEQESKKENPKRARLNRQKRKGVKVAKDKIAKNSTSKAIKIQKVSGGKVPIKKVLNKLPIKKCISDGKTGVIATPQPKPRAEKKVQFVGVDGQPFIIRRPEPLTSEAILKSINDNTSRDELVKIIESGRLSPSDTVIAVRKLRENLISKVRGESMRLSREHSTSTPSPTVSKAKSGEQTGKAGASEKYPVGHELNLSDTPAGLGVSQIDNPKRKRDDKNKSKPVISRSGMSIKEKMQAKPADSKGSKGRARPKAPYARRLIAAGDPAETKVVKTGPIKVTKAQQKEGFEIQTVVPEELALTPVEKLDQEPVPGLVYGLDRVLFNPGVVHLQDPRSRVFNFDPYLQKITPVSEFNFNALKEYKTSSRDTTLIQLTKEEKKKYTGSTSSMSSALAHFHFLLSQWRPITTSMLSRTFPVEFNTFTKLQRGPTALFLRWRDGAYAIDADKEYDTSTVLMMLGKSMEKLLTLPKDHYEKYLMENADNFPEEARYEPETFHYTTIGDFLLRSQLDAFDPRLPGTGMFDLKTRAVISVRMDTKAYQEASGYEIKREKGEFESYEREYYDMIRAAFLKYSLQVRMGRMDGIFVAFHNTERIFGFQYVSLNEMDLALHGSEDTTIGDLEFKTSLDLLNQALNRITEKYPEKSVRLHLETRAGDTPFMYIFAEPMEEEEIDKIQATNREEIARFEEEILGIKPKNDSLQQKKNAEWEKLRSKVEESIEEDEMDIQEIRSIAENLLEESEYWDDLSPEEKQRCIESLVKSATLSEEPENTEEQSENVFVDEADGQNDDDVADEDEEIESDDETDNEKIDEADVEEEGEPKTHEENQVIQAEFASEQTSEEGSFLGIESEETILDDSTDEADDSEQSIASQLSTDESSIEETNQLKPRQDPSKASELGETNDDVSVLKKEVKASHDNPDTEEVPSPTEVLAMTLTIRNKVDGEYVARPVDLSDGQKWTIEYALVDVAPKERAALLYEACKRRRFESLHWDEEGEPDPFSYNNFFIKQLKTLAKKGRQWRTQLDKEDSKRPVKVLGWSDPVKVEIEDKMSATDTTEVEKKNEKE